jgi:hypothetical protein
MIVARPDYEPPYYERSAQRFIADHLQAPLFLNVPWGIATRLPSRNEIDAVVQLDNRIVPIEIKSFTLDADDVEAVMNKHAALGSSSRYGVADGEGHSSQGVAVVVPTVTPCRTQPCPVTGMMSYGDT